MNGKIDGRMNGWLDDRLRDELIGWTADGLGEWLETMDR